MNMTSCYTKKCTNQNGRMGQSEVVGGLTTIVYQMRCSSEACSRAPDFPCQLLWWLALMLPPTGSEGELLTLPEYQVYQVKCSIWGKKMGTGSPNPGRFLIIR